MRDGKEKVDDAAAAALELEAQAAAVVAVDDTADVNEVETTEEEAANEVKLAKAGKRSAKVFRKLKPKSRRLSIRNTATS
ncbi:hypothetical protein IPL68_06765 [Candidatus Saccharibacteria bacterium]|nr:MAG: hypothetical protein IPL68_06765 [Candidatus Saccharibacteria bacterium]